MKGFSHFFFPLCTALFDIKGFLYTKIFLYILFRKSREIAFSEFLGRIMISLFFFYSLIFYTSRPHKREKKIFFFLFFSSSVYWGIKLKCRSDKSPLANINRIEIKIFMFLNWQRVFQSSSSFFFHCRSFSFIRFLQRNFFFLLFFLIKRIFLSLLEFWTSVSEGYVWCTNCW